MPIVSLTVLVIMQLLCIKDAKDKRYSDTFILCVVMFPVIGALIYLVVEFLMPSIEGTKRKLRSKGPIVFKRPDPLTQLETKVAKLPSQENVLALAQAHIKNDNFEMAYRTIYPLLKNKHLYTVELLVIKATLELDLEMNQQAFDSIKQALALSSHHDLSAMKVFAKALVANHHFEAAMFEYEKMLSMHYDFETHFHYIRLLIRLNLMDKAKFEMEHLVGRYRTLPKQERKENRKWLSLVHQNYS